MTQPRPTPNVRTWPGTPAPLGATYDGAGTNFAVFAEGATRVELCLFDDRGVETPIALPERIGWIWHGYLPDIGPGTRYGYRVHGDRDRPGDITDPNKLLLDPYAQAVEGRVRWSDALFDGSVEDSAPSMPRSVVINPYFDWGHDHPPNTPWHRTVLYEAHVKGLTKSHPDVPPELRGTYLGLASPPIIEHLRALGVTAIELMPVHQFIHDRRLHDLGLRNYWGYNSIAYLAPHNEYAAGGQLGAQVQEFKVMVRTLHEAGIEVILDVVYNHTAEGGAGGPILCFKGLDNPGYYRLDPADPSRYVDYTGTGNSLNMRHPHVLQLIMDSLRYWVTEMHVDGFRFDLAATLARELHDVDRLSAFFDLIQQDPVVSRVKLIAEPWDVGEGGYQVGNFPPNWSEWNGRYRDCVRDYWRGAEFTLGEFAARLTGSSDLYENDGRRPHASVNFVTCHDGFTLTDLVSYNHKHNTDNGEDNRDGTDDNRSWNCGIEGPTADANVTTLRARQRRNLLATLLLSQGVPMLTAGDEIGRTQHGNNNAYCQDNEISWVDWSAAEADLLAFTRWLVGFRQAHPAFRRRRFFTGRPVNGDEVKDLAWFTPTGTEMTTAEWTDPANKAVGVYLNGAGIDEPGPRGETVADDTFLVVFNAHSGPVQFMLPERRWGGRWVVRLDTATETPPDPAEAALGVRSPHPGRGPRVHRSELAAGDRILVAGRSVVVLERAD